MYRRGHSSPSPSSAFLQELHEKKQLYKKLENLLDLVSKGETDWDENCDSIASGDAFNNVDLNCSVGANHGIETTSAAQFSPLPHVRLLNDSPSQTQSRTPSPLVERHDVCASGKSPRTELTSVLKNEVLYHQLLLKRLQNKKLQLEHTLAAERLHVSNELHGNDLLMDNVSDAETPSSTVSVPIHVEEEPTNSALFEAMRDTIYTEAAVLISKNESRPHFLIELFKELQKLNNDYLRQHCLYQIQDVISKYLSDFHIPEESLFDLEPDIAGTESMASWRISFDNQWLKSRHLGKNAPGQEHHSCGSSLSDSLDCSESAFDGTPKGLSNGRSEQPSSAASPDLLTTSQKGKLFRSAKQPEALCIEREDSSSKISDTITDDDDDLDVILSNTGCEPSEKVEEMAKEDDELQAGAAEKSVVLDLSVSETRPLTSYGSGEDEEEGSGDEYEFNEPDIATSMQQDALSVLRKDNIR